MCAHFCVTLREVAGLTDVHASRSRLVVEGKARCAPFPERNIQSSPVGQSAPQKGAKNEARRSYVDVPRKRLYIKYRIPRSSNATSSFWKAAKMFGLIGEKVSRVKIKKINRCVARVLLVFAK